MLRGLPRGNHLTLSHCKPPEDQQSNENGHRQTGVRTKDTHLFCFHHHHDQKVAPADAAVTKYRVTVFSVNFTRIILVKLLRAAVLYVMATLQTSSYQLWPYQLVLVVPLQPSSAIKNPDLLKRPDTIVRSAWPSGLSICSGAIALSF